MQQTILLYCGECLDLLLCEQAKSATSPPTPPGQHTPLHLLVIFLLILLQILPPFPHCCKAMPSSLYCLYSNCGPSCICHCHGVPPNCNHAHHCCFICLSLVAVDDICLTSLSLALVTQPPPALFRAAPMTISLEINKRLCLPPTFCWLMVVFSYVFSF